MAVVPVLSPRRNRFGSISKGKIHDRFSSMELYRLPSSCVVTVTMCEGYGCHDHRNNNGKSNGQPPELQHRKLPERKCMTTLIQHDAGGDNYAGDDVSSKNNNDINMGNDNDTGDDREDNDDNAGEFCCISPVLQLQQDNESLIHFVLSEGNPIVSSPSKIPIMDRRYRVCGRQCVIAFEHIPFTESFQNTLVSSQALLAFLIMEHHHHRDNSEALIKPNDMETNGDVHRRDGSCSSRTWSNWRVIDLQSTRGLVGLGLAAISGGMCATTILTENATTEQRLYEAIDRNSSYWMFGTRTFTPAVQQYLWSGTSSTSIQTTSTPTSSSSATERICRIAVRESCIRRFTYFGQDLLQRRKRWYAGQKVPPLREYRSKGTGHDHRDRDNQCQEQIILSGADMLHDPSRFRSLLGFIAELLAKLYRNAGQSVRVECWLACHALTNLKWLVRKFANLASSEGFVIDFAGYAVVPRTNSYNYVQQVRIHRGTDMERFPSGEGIAWIFQIRRRPYAFTV